MNNDKELPFSLPKPVEVLNSLIRIKLCHFLFKIVTDHNLIFYLQNQIKELCVYLLYDFLHFFINRLLVLVYF